MTQAGSRKARPTVWRGAFLLPWLSTGKKNAVAVKQLPAEIQQTLWEKGRGNAHTFQRLILSHYSIPPICEVAWLTPLLRL